MPLIVSSNFLKKKVYSKEQNYFCFAKSISIFIGGESIGNLEPVLGSSLFLKGLMFQNLLSQYFRNYGVESRARIASLIKTC